MSRDPKAAKPYSSPSLVELDRSAAKAKLEAKGNPKDAITQKMLSFIDDQLNKGESGLHISVVQTVAKGDLFG